MKYIEASVQVVEFENQDVVTASDAALTSALENLGINGNISSDDIHALTALCKDSDGLANLLSDIKDGTVEVDKNALNNIHHLKEWIGNNNNCTGTHYNYTNDTEDTFNDSEFDDVEW